MSFDVLSHKHVPIEIYGETGSLIVPDPNNFDGEVRLSTVKNEWRKVATKRPYADANYRIIGLAEMAHAIRAGRPHRANGELALHALEVMEGFQTSSDSGPPSKSQAVRIGRRRCRRSSARGGSTSRARKRGAAWIRKHPMREALIVWGGWSGHEPEQGARIVASMLESEGFKVHVENTTEAFADPAIRNMSLIVPIVTMSKIEKEEVENLTAAVRSGVGLAGYHGGMCDSFREAVDYQFMCGGQWVAHPGNVIDYRVDIAKPDDPIVQGIDGFQYRSSNITCMSTRRTRCWRQPPSRASTRPGRRAS